MFLLAHFWLHQYLRIHTMHWDTPYIYIYPIRSVTIYLSFWKRKNIATIIVSATQPTTALSNMIWYVRLVWGVKVKCPWTIANWLSSLVHLSTPPKVGWDQKSVDLGPARAATNCLSSLMPSCPITQGLLHTPFQKKKLGQEPLVDQEGARCLVVQ